MRELAKEIRAWRSWRLLTLAVLVLFLKVLVGIVLGYRQYLPPDFTSDFLFGRDRYFFGAYQWAFWVHLASGPASLVLGLLLVSAPFRKRFPCWHRRLGRVQAVNVLCLLAPSGFWMAFFAQSGPVAGVSLGLLSLLTAFTIAMGWRLAIQRKFVEHRRWMLRNFALLCSAIVLRVLAGGATSLEVSASWFNPAVAWISWLAPLAVLETFFILTGARSSKLARIVPAGDRQQSLPGFDRNGRSEEPYASVGHSDLKSAGMRRL